MIRILKYMKSPSGKGLSCENKDNIQIEGYSVVDWGSSAVDRRSTLGYCILIGGNLISLRSKKHNIVARSSAETEYHAMASTCELTWLRQLITLTAQIRRRQGNETNM